jgi:iron complex outermembrane receptor protein
MKNLPIATMPLMLSAALAATADADAAMRPVADIADLDLEQLTRITVTTASRRAERVIEAPASIFVITGEDIRRSGASSLPEILRLAPNLQVARADNNQYAITARGFNNVLANKLLVLIDGRTIYTPLFSGVFWEAQDLVYEDIDRIEVISGPGATLWGANAVNGVINIITLPARATAGPLAEGLVGTDEKGISVRTGALFGGDGAWRAYAKYWDRDHQDLTNGDAIKDASKRANVGFRTDWGRDQSQWTVQGDFYWGDIDMLPSARTISGGNILGRLVRQLGPDSTLRIQAYYDRTDREHPTIFKEQLDTFDLEAQHSLHPLPGHELIWGGGYRHSRDQVTNTNSQAFIPAERGLTWSNVFVQDEIALSKSVTLTAGLKAERNPYTGVEWLPNLRLAWRVGSEQLVWGALSRAVRAPSRIDREIYFPGVPPFVLVGNDTFEAEIADVAEVGYRAQLTSTSSLSATVFHHRYPNLRSVAPAGTSRIFANDIEGTVRGIEGWGSWRALPTWRLTGGFVFQDIDTEVKSGHLDFGGRAQLGNDAERTAMLRSTWDITPRHELDFTVRYVGKLPAPEVAAYTVVDARMGWKPVPSVDISLIVQNLFDKEHAEWGPPNNRAVFDRAVMLRVVWKP